MQDFLEHVCMDVTPVARFCVYPICDATLQTHVHSRACMGGNPKFPWAPPRTTKQYCVTTCHAETSQKNNQCFFFFKKSPYWNSMRSRDVISQTTSKQNRMELPLVVSTSSLSECPVLKKTCSAISLEKSTCAWLKLQSHTHPFHTTAHTRGENMGLSQTAGVSNVFSASTGPTFDQPHSVEWC